MIYIQRVRSNDIGDDYGKQVELGKVFMSHHKWETGEIPVSITFCALSENQSELNGTKIKTTFKVRGDERGGDRIGVDCKEYANQNRICVLKQFMTDKLHLTPGEDYFILEDVGNDGRSFKLYGVHSNDLPASMLLDKFRGQVVDMAEPQNEDSFSVSDVEPLQLIYFGAPGTGKSHRIKQVCKKYEHYRITFHPDTDYASFVGSYKPITHKEQVYTNMGDKAIPLKDSVTGEPVTTTKITYQYVYQAFLNAYIAAWREQQNDEPKSVYLVIEEINRGNCAQIFGDIFQLLDRNDFGFSDYPIVADNDLKKELAREFSDLEVANAGTINDIYDDGMVAKVKSGSHLLLPNNLHIWATMNTSDQSLFPIDSAFKRRWEWKYVKIADSGMNYRIAVNGKEYDWWEFVQAINAVIGSEIEQEDKKLGYFFAKAKKNAEGKWIISADTLLSKVLFFIYNDVFKDYGFDYEMFKGEEEKPMTFADYFDEYGDTIEPRVERFVLNLGLSPLSSDETVVDEEASGNDADYKTIKVNVNGEQKTTMTTAMIAILEDAARSHSMDEIESAVKEYITRGDDPIIKRVDNPDTYTKENRWNKTIIRSSDGVAFVVTTMWLRRFLPMIEKLAEHFNVPFEVVNP